MPEFENPQPGSATPTPESTPAPATQGAPSVAATTQPTQVPATGTVEDRSNWVPPHRLREQRESYERRLNEVLAAERQQWQQQLQEHQRKIAALAGVAPQQQSEEEIVKQQFAKLFPHLGELTPEDIRDLRAMRARASELENQTAHYWQSYGNQQASRLKSLAEADLGPISEAQERNLIASLIGYIKSDPSGELENRYASDPNFITEFYKAFSSSFIDPVRRSQGAGVISRAQVPVPQDSPSGSVRVGQAPPKAEGTDAKADLAWQMFKDIRNRG